MCLSGRIEIFSAKAGVTILATILTSVIDVEVGETEASFLVS